jgi:hypothetical protein
VKDERARPSQADFLERYRARTEAQNAAARATLEPLAPGERPWPLRVAVTIATVAGGLNLALFGAGVTIAGKHPSAGPTVLFSVVMLGCAYGMWQLWSPVVLAFMAVLAVVICLFSLLLLEASNLLGVLVPPVFIVGGGWLFWKLVRVLGRIQAPRQTP